MPYPEHLIVGMRQDLVQYGVEETRTAEALDAALAPDSGTVLVVVNSVCGCAAGKARPAVGMALRAANRPDKAITVFAGADEDAVDHLRHGKLAAFPASSPCMALFRNGEPVFMLHRRDIESRDAITITQVLTEAFDRYCTKTTA